MVKVRGSSFSAHRVVLACQSPYFMRLFTGPGQAARSVVHLDQVASPAGFQLILDYMYSGGEYLGSK